MAVVAKTVVLGVAQSHTRATTAETLIHLEGLANEASSRSIHLLLFPEAYLGGYPRACNFQSSIGARTDAGREQFLHHFNAAIDLGDTPSGGGEEWIKRELEIKSGSKHRGDGTREKLEAIAKNTGVFLVVGVIEKAGASLYCAVVYVCPKSGCIGKRRKVMPTGTERLIWAQGSPSTLKAVRTTLNGVDVALAAAVCWENFMPLLRFSLYSQGVNVYLAPTADARETWLPLMQTIASEGRCFVLSSNQCVERKDLPGWIAAPSDQKPAASSIAYPARGKLRRKSTITKTVDNHEIVICSPDEPNDLEANEEAVVEESADSQGRDFVCRGGSCIVSPYGKALAGPLWEETDSIISATVDLNEIVRSKLDFDAAGHYSRNDSFELKVKGLDLSPPP